MLTSLATFLRLARACPLLSLLLDQNSLPATSRSSFCHPFAIIHNLEPDIAELQMSRYIIMKREVFINKI